MTAISPTDVASVDFFVDESSCREILRALAGTKGGEADPWAWGTARTLTSLLVFRERGRIAIAPEVPSRTEDLYARLRSGLGGIAESQEPSLARDAATRARGWATTARLGLALERTLTHTQFPAWLDWYVRSWPDHVARYGGIFDARFLDSVARVLDIPSGEAATLHARYSDRVTLERAMTRFWSSGMDDEVRPIVEGWVAAALVRARYYDTLAGSSGLQVQHHPFRQFAFPSDTRHEQWYGSLFEEYLANLILASSFAERRRRRRLGLYIENLQRLHKGRAALRRPNELTTSSDAQLSAAVDEARRLGITVHGKHVELGLNIALTGTLAASLIFTPLPIHFVAIKEVVDAAGGLSLHETGVGSRLAGRITRRPRHLRSLAQAGPGRVEFQRPQA
jgi:hypothetical protein